MANNDNLITEEQVPSNWEPVEKPTIVPGEAPGGAPAPPAPNDMPQFFSGSLPPSLQLSPYFAGTETASPRIPKTALMPLGTQANAFTNSASQSTATTTVVTSPGSITLEVPSIFTPASQTTTLPGPVIVALASQSANEFFAGPVSGSAAAPGFRMLAAADITFVIPVANGGTGQDTLPAHEVLVGEGTSAVASIPNGTAGYVLTSNGSGADPTFQAAGGGFTAAVKINGVGTSLDKQFFINGVSDGSKPTWVVQINGTADGG